MAASIYTGSVSIAPTGNAVEVEALLLEGHLESGMYLHVPLNPSLSLTILVQEVIFGEGGSVKLVLDGGEEREDAEFVESLDFEDETLIVTEEGQR